ncbi:MAG: 30S ribosomal protein S20 [Candidatus Zixiibacteriota bacterium]
MPHHKSCKKRMKTSALSRERNRSLRSNLKKSVKALRGCQTRAEAEKMIPEVVGVIDKAAHGNIIHKKKAARDKSRLMAMVSKLAG